MNTYQPNIVFVVNFLTRGGIFTALKSTLATIKCTNFHIEVISIYKSDTDCVKHLPNQVRFRSLDKWRTNIAILRSIYSRLFDFPIVQKKLLKIQLKRSKSYIVIAYSDGRASELVSSIDISYKIAWVHTDIFSHYNQGQKKIQETANFLKKYDHVITVSNFLKQKVQRFLGNNRNISVVYNPIPFHEISKLAKEDAPNIKGKFILSVGRLSYEKGMDLLIKAYSMLPSSTQHLYPLFIIGDGPEKSKLILLIYQLGLTSQVKLLGALDNPYPYIKRASLVVIPSIFEGFGLVAAEAQALGVPVLGTRTGGIIEILAHGKMGILCENTKESMAASLQRALEDLSALKIYVENAKNGLSRFKSRPVKDLFMSMGRLQLSLYANGPTGNHGCEAIYLSLSHILNIQEVLTLDNTDENSPLWEMMHTRQSAIIRNDLKKMKLSWLKFKLMSCWLNSDYAYYLQLFDRFSNQIVPGRIYASVGGDNYCYKASRWLYALNRIIRKNKGKTILLGCSINPEDIDAEMLNDLRGFDLILARESITFDALREKGLNQVEHVPDPAFLLESRECPLPLSFVPNASVGINISPVILKNEVKSGIVIRSIEKTIEYILKCTKLNIALIPHVILPENSDLELLEPLYAKYSSTGRISLFSNKVCTELKYIISRCRYLIAARTHASIAAYSQSVPTLVIGYSVKAKGIAKDLFGTAENYVLDIHDIVEERTLLNHFLWIMDHEIEIKANFQNKLPHYVESLSSLSEIINNHLFSQHAK